MRALRAWLGGNSAAVLALFFLVALFTLAGLIFARTGAAQRLSALFLAAFGGAVRGTVLAAALLCSAFTAFTGGSGVTILALGGLLLPLLTKAGYPEQRGVGLVTSASALGAASAVATFPTTTSN